MYYDENDTPAMARTSNLNEELGQVSNSVIAVLYKWNITGLYCKSKYKNLVYRRYIKRGVTF